MTDNEGIRGRLGPLPARPAKWFNILARSGPLEILPTPQDTPTETSPLLRPEQPHRSESMPLENPLRCITEPLRCITDSLPNRRQTVAGIRHALNMVWSLTRQSHTRVDETAASNVSETTRDVPHGDVVIAEQGIRSDTVHGEQATPAGERPLQTTGIPDLGIGGENHEEDIITDHRTSVNIDHHSMQIEQETQPVSSEITAPVKLGTQGMVPAEVDIHMTEVTESSRMLIERTALDKYKKEIWPWVDRGGPLGLNQYQEDFLDKAKQKFIDKFHEQAITNSLEEASNRHREIFETAFQEVFNAEYKRTAILRFRKMAKEGKLPFHLSEQDFQSIIENEDYIPLAFSKGRHCGVEGIRVKSTIGSDPRTICIPNFDGESSDSELQYIKLLDGKNMNYNCHGYAYLRGEGQTYAGRVFDLTKRAFNFIGKVDVQPGHKVLYYMESYEGQRKEDFNASNIRHSGIVVFKDNDQIIVISKLEESGDLGMHLIDDPKILEWYGKPQIIRPNRPKHPQEVS